MTRKEHVDRVWDIVEQVAVGMLTTRGPRGLRARPLEARPDRNAKAIWFITDIRSSKEGEIAADNEIGLAFIDKDKTSISRSPAGPMNSAIRILLLRFGARPTTCGGTGRTTRTSASCGSPL
jgi:hypothetical protein